MPLKAAQQMPESDRLQNHDNKKNELPANNHKKKSLSGKK
jgi:hypothetical protein